MNLKQIYFLVFACVCSYCCTIDKTKRIHLIARTQFRKSVFEPDKLSNRQLDSFDKADPEILETFDSTEQIGLKLLAQNGYVTNNTLKLNAIEKIINSKKVFLNRNLKVDTFFLKLENDKQKSFIYFHGDNLTDSIQIDWPMQDYGLFLVNDSLRKVVVFYNQWHISNGDNYDFYFYEVQ